MADTEVFDPEIVDEDTFGQILEMDDDDDHEFSFEMAVQYLKQAKDTIKELGESLEEPDLPKVSNLGHFLKGSSDSLGLYKVAEKCRALQYLGAKRDETGEVDIEEDKALELAKVAYDELKPRVDDAEGFFRRFYKGKDFSLEENEEDEE